MKWVSTFSEKAQLESALDEALAALVVGLDGKSPDLAILFLSEHHRAGSTRVGEIFGRKLPRTLLFGCTARSVIGGGREIEGGPGASLTAASLPGVELHPFHLEPESPATLARGPEARDAWTRLVGLAPDERPSFVLLSDPFTFDTERFVRALDASFPASKKVGGVASGGTQAGENALFLASEVHRSGLIGLALGGAIELDTIVAQGCRPIGAPMFVTRCRDNLLQELDGRSPVQILHELYRDASARDHELFRTSLFLGIEMKESQSEYQQGDFLIRNLIGLDEESGAIAIGAMLHPTQVVQFHLRDAATSADDLEKRLTMYRRTGPPGLSPEGALLFSCLGRGKHLYGEPDHDTNAFRQHLGDIALGGFFCNGEIGPVQGTTFLHGYTSAFGIFRDRAKKTA